ncbi:MAG: AAA family ATPase [Chlamydiales bacterium]|nr:AAA family ATPase [Chlamydiales bacterium]
MGKKGFFVASTGQHVGKTTTCLGLLSGLKKRFESVGFIKPVGQEQMETACGRHVDKDVVLFKEHFGLKTAYENMSPVLLPHGFTRDFLDGEIDEKELSKRIQAAYANIDQENQFTLAEGTGHISVGSIVNMNNAQVASLLKLPIILVAPGGVGSSFDQLALNRAVCEKHGVRVAGVILNRVLPDKREMITTYMGRALSRWNIPLLGCIPYDPFLSNPSMKDFEQLFETQLLSGEEARMRHFRQTRIGAASSETYCDLIEQNQLIITPAAREDIIRATLQRHWEIKMASPHDDLETGMILTGDIPPAPALVEEIRRASIPMLYTPVTTYAAMQMITSFTAKIRNEDTQKVREAIAVVESHIDFNRLLDTIHN